MRRAALGENSIWISSISREHFNGRAVVSIINSLHLPQVLGWEWTQTGPYLDDGRNQAMLNWYVHPSQTPVFLFVDSDCEWDPDDVLTVCQAAVDRNAVVGGLYYGLPNGGVEALAYRRRSNPADAKHLFRALTKETAKDKPRTLLKCDAVGTGFMAIPRTIADAVRQPNPLPWFSEPVIDQSHLGEDLAFCTLVRSMGYDVFVHRGARVRHAKTIILDPNL